MPVVETNYIFILKPVSPIRYFDRDVACIRRYFEKKMGYVTESWPQFKDILANERRIDGDLQASGFSCVDNDVLAQVDLFSLLMLRLSFVQ
tara:strand:- start:1295 stop:1567 length:273 start_codon:yes stop_codon:yes gene_type:complete